MRAKQKGVLILSVGRSGSTWLGSLTNSTEQLGVSSEWFNPAVFGEEGRELTAEVHIEAAVKKASTENGFFAIKIFANQIERFSDREGIDIVKRLCDLYDVRVIRLERKDTFRQAISYARGLQTKKWASTNKEQQKPVYDFAQICHCFFLIKKGYSFWQTYSEARELGDKLFYYEDMVTDPMPYVSYIQEHAGVEHCGEVSSGLSVQRDAITETWLERFKAEIAQVDLMPYVEFNANHKKKTLKNKGLKGRLRRLLKKRCVSDERA